MPASPLSSTTWPSPSWLCAQRSTQQRHFCVPAHQGREARGARHVQATLRRAFLQDPIDLQGAGQPFEGVAAQVLAGKVALHQAVRRRTDHHRIGRRQALEAGRNVGRVAQGQLFLPAAAAHVAHDHQPGMDADAGRPGARLGPAPGGY